MRRLTGLLPTAEVSPFQFPLTQSILSLFLEPVLSTWTIFDLATVQALNWLRYHLSLQ